MEPLMAVNQAGGNTVNLPRNRAGRVTRTHVRAAQRRWDRLVTASPPLRWIMLLL